MILQRGRSSPIMMKQLRCVEMGAVPGIATLMVDRVGGADSGIPRAVWRLCGSRMFAMWPSTMKAGIGSMDVSGNDSAMKQNSVSPGRRAPRRDAARTSSCSGSPTALGRRAARFGVTRKGGTPSTFSGGIRSQRVVRRRFRPPGRGLLHNILRLAARIQKSRWWCGGFAVPASLR